MEVSREFELVLVLFSYFANKSILAMPHLYLLSFTETSDLCSSQRQLVRSLFFAAVNHNYRTANEPWKTETDKMNQNLPIASDKHDLLTQAK